MKNLFGGFITGVVFALISSIFLGLTAAPFTALAYLLGVIIYYLNTIINLLEKSGDE